MIVFDLETYPNCFTLAAVSAECPVLTWQFEVSDYRDDRMAIRQWCLWLKQNGQEMVGFNNVGFDYPVLHMLLRNANTTAADLYSKAMSIINSFDGAQRFVHMVYPSDRLVPQIDLYKIHHFDNKARSTSLKALEFNMRMDNVSDLPFPVGTVLNQEQIKLLHQYNMHDVQATLKFLHETAEQIAFRRDLTAQYPDKDVMNASDVKIGSIIFEAELSKFGVQLYDYTPETGRKPRQTKRQHIRLADCIPTYVKFNNPEFERVHQWMRQQVITETKGVFEDVKAKVGGLEFVFGTGGIHASVENRIYDATDEMMILDIDVGGMYPAIAIGNEYYPAHLGKKFVEVYKHIIAERAKHKKGTMLNGAYKLAGNGAYGKSNDPFSVFYDPQFTMSVTITGQLSLAMLSEQLLAVDGVQIIQANTDGITMYLPRTQYDAVKQVCAAWEKLTKLTLEEVEYKRMAIRDVNSYIAVGTNGKVKRKGTYEYNVQWHQNASCLVIPKVAEKVIVEGAPIRETLENWPDRMDFMHRVKVPRSSRLVGVDEQGTRRDLQNTTRYYVSKGGERLIKIMPPLAKKPGVWREIGVESGWTVCECNDIRNAVLPVDVEYYINEIEKLTLRLQ